MTRERLVRLLYQQIISMYVYVSYVNCIMYIQIRLILVSCSTPTQHCKVLLGHCAVFM